MSVGRICVREVNVASPEETVREIARRMAEQGVGTLVVLDDAKRPCGLLTDRDLVLRVLATGEDPATTRVADVMTRDPKTIAEGSPIESALGLMRAGSFRRLPVIDRGGRLVGIVSLDDVLALLAEEFAQIGGVLQQQSR